MTSCYSYEYDDNAETFISKLFGIPTPSDYETNIGRIINILEQHEDSGSYSQKIINNRTKYYTDNYKIQQEFQTTPHIEGFCSTPECKTLHTLSYIYHPYLCITCLAKKINNKWRKVDYSITVNLNVQPCEGIPSEPLFGTMSTMVHDDVLYVYAVNTKPNKKSPRKHKKSVAKKVAECSEFEIIYNSQMKTLDITTKKPLYFPGSDSYRHGTTTAFLNNTFLCKGWLDHGQCLGDGYKNFTPCRESGQETLIEKKPYCYSCGVKKAKQKRARAYDNNILKIETEGTTSSDESSSDEFGKCFTKLIEIAESKSKNDDKFKNQLFQAIHTLAGLNIGSN